MVFFHTSSNTSLSPTSTSSLPTSPTSSMVEQTIQNAESIIKKWDLNASSLITITPLFHPNRKEAKDYLKCVMDLRGTMHFLVSQNSAPHKLVIAQTLMQIATKRLEKEFYQILSSNRERLDPELVSTSLSSDGSASFDVEEDEADQLKIAGESISEAERVSALAMADLKAIAECMSSSGYGKECAHIYKLFRKSIVDRGLYLLGIEKFKSSRINKMDREYLHLTIKNWLNAVKIALKSLFNGEKILCDHVFSASQTIRDACFAEITTEGAKNLFKFPELIAKNKNSPPDRIFRLLELHGAISELRPDIESIFNVELTSAIKLQALSSLQKVGGGIHPLAQSTMSYLSSLSDYDRILTDIISIHPPIDNALFPESYFNDPTVIEAPKQAASVHLAWLILILLCKIDSKAQLYEDLSLSYLFLANNLQFIINQVQTSTLKHLLGHQWLSRHTQKIKQYALSYESVAWNRVFESLPERTTSELSYEAVKDCFKRFNAAFEQVYVKQISWIVPDGKLRDELKVSIAGKLVPVYREFYETFWTKLNADFVRVSPDDLGNYLSDLFHGTRISSSSLLQSSSHSKGCLLR
ncbi:hypothetical protein ERO13_D05G299166v2 [Gossypium hirsutum]|nr:hypothetical protein ERO13_D05G299166v2 [Gossypium hirsutum]